MENPQELLTRMDAVQIEIHQAENTVEKLKAEVATLWKEFKEWEGTFATSIGMTAEPKRTKRTLKPRSLESNLRVALTHSLNRSKAGGLSKCWILEREAALWEAQDRIRYARKGIAASDQRSV